MAHEVPEQQRGTGHDDLQYDRIGEDYERSKELPLTRYVERPGVLGLLRDVRGKSVLDLACGTGVYSRHARRLGARRVLGVDISPKMIEVARTHEEQDRLGVLYAVGDAAELPPLGAFDLVLAIYLFNYADSPATLERMARACADNLCEGGELRAFMARPGFDFSRPVPQAYGFSFEQEETLEHGSRVRVSASGERPFSFSAYLPDADVMEEAFTAAGFEDFSWASLEPSVDGVLEYGPGFWDEFTANPTWTVFRARKAGPGAGS
ncbi:class I SAM-dependent methyltransferase [Streptomyces gamaensis]|uniref:Class I SAM-dependent methyltransferase n=1 Tax=Streptomyces gamaensis TaxID=1763542 RepID=A0ABW0Z6I8_9ACTN